MLSIHRNIDGSYRLLSSGCGSVQRELPHSKYECEEQDNLYVRSSQAALRHYVLQRGSEIGSIISPQAYNLLEERLLYGGSNKLSLVYADFDILDWHYTVIGAPDDYYPGAIQTLRDDFGLDYCDLICFFAGEDPFIFVHRDPGDRLIYLFCENDFNFYIMGHEEDWVEAVYTFDTIIRRLRAEPRALILATRENRERYRNGWRPSPLANFGVYE